MNLKEAILEGRRLTNEKTRDIRDKNKAMMMAQKAADMSEYSIWCFSIIQDLTRTIERLHSDIDFLEQGREYDSEMIEFALRKGVELEKKLNEPAS